MEKIVKRNYFNGLVNVVKVNPDFTMVDGDVVMTADDIAEWAQAQVDQLDKKAAKAKEYAKAKADKPDEMMDTLFEALTSEFQTVGDIVASIGNEEITASKAIYRLNKLVESGKAQKTDMKIKGSKGTKKGFALA